MLEASVREGVDEQLELYEQEGCIDYLSHAFKLLSKSTPPINIEERVEWVNQLVSYYRKVAKVFIDAEKKEEILDKSTAEEVPGKTLLEKIGDF